MNILIVEDRPEVAWIASQLMQAVGHQAHIVISAEAALRHLEGAPNIDVLFSDIRLGPGLNGIELAEIVARDHPHVRILLTTGYSSAAAVAGSVQWPVLHKPYLKAALREAIDKL